MDLHELPSDWPQRKDSISDQLADLILIANRLKFYDAADALKQIYQNLPEVKYGCYCDLEEHMDPDACVIDTNEHHLCHYAKPNMRKEQCEYWRIIT